MYSKLDQMSLSASSARVIDLGEDGFVGDFGGVSIVFLQSHKMGWKNSYSIYLNASDGALQHLQHT